jgi:hypothetical protein
MTEFDLPPKALQSGQASCPAIAMPRCVVEPGAETANERAPLRVEHAASAITGRTQKLRVDVEPAKDLLALDAHPLVAVNHDPISERLDRHRQPRAAPA